MDSDKQPTPADFVAIVGEATLEDAEKYLKMGKYSLELALNYYYNKKDKSIKPPSSQQPMTFMQKLQEGTKKQAHMEKMVKDLTKGGPKTPKTSGDVSSKKKSPNKKILVTPASNPVSSSNKSVPKRQNSLDEILGKAPSVTKDNKTPTTKGNEDKKVTPEPKEKPLDFFGSWKKENSKKLATPSTEGPKDIPEEEKEGKFSVSMVIDEMKNSMGFNPFDDGLDSKDQEAGSMIRQTSSIFMADMQDLQGPRPTQVDVVLFSQGLSSPKMGNVRKNFKRTFAQFSVAHEEGSGEANRDCEMIEEAIKNQQWPKLLGCMMTKAHVISSLKVDAKEGDGLQLKLEKQASTEKKKGPRSKMTTSNTPIPAIIRVLHQDQEIGKLDGQISQFLASLIDKEYLVLEATLGSSPSSWTTFATFHLNVNVYVAQKAVTKPLTKVYASESNLTIEEESLLNDLQCTKEGFVFLLDFLGLKRTTPTLIKTSPIKSSMGQSQNLTQASQKADKKAGKVESSQKLARQNSTSSQNHAPEGNEEAKDEGKDNAEVIIELLKELSFEDSEYEGLNPFKTHDVALTLTVQEKKLLSWMLLREGWNEQHRERLYKKTRMLHVLWEEYRLGDGSYLYFNPFTGQLCMEVPKNTHDCSGGILMNIPGPMKAELVAGLAMHSRYEKDPSSSFSRLTLKKKYLSSIHGKTNLSNIMQGPLLPAGTLLIVPMSSLYFWDNELNRLSQNGNIFKILVYYGQKRSNDQKDLGAFDIVLTTYGIVSGEFSSEGIKELYSFEWARVILDEAHYVKGRRIQTTKAIEDLNIFHRWCFTSYKARNKPDDLYNMINFLKLEPWSCLTWWNAYIGKPLDKGDEDALKILYTILKPVTLVLEDDTDALNKQKESLQCLIPEKEYHVEWIDLPNEEKNFYMCLLKKSKLEYDSLIAEDSLMENYSYAFELMMRIRQSCDHLFLIYSKFEVKDSDSLEREITDFLRPRDSDAHIQELHDELSIPDEKSLNNKLHDHFEILMDETTRTEQVFAIQKPHVVVNDQIIHETVERLNHGDIVHCPLCLCDLENVTITVCGHILCNFCVKRSIEAKSMCPACNTILTRKDCLYIARNIVFGSAVKDRYRRSTKLEIIMNKVQKAGTEKNKTVVLSHFSAMILLIECDFIQSGIAYIKVDSAMSEGEKLTKIKQFNTSPDIFVLIMPVAVGRINTETITANNIIIVEPSNEEGFERELLQNIYPQEYGDGVEVVRLACKGTVEEGIISLNERRKENGLRDPPKSPEERIQNNLEDLCYLIKMHEN